MIEHSWETKCVLSFCMFNDNLINIRRWISSWDIEQIPSLSTLPVQYSIYRLWITQFTIFIFQYFFCSPSHFIMYIFYEWTTTKPSINSIIKSHKMSSSEILHRLIEKHARVKKTSDSWEVLCEVKKEKNIAKK